MSPWFPLDDQLGPEVEVDIFAFPYAGASAEAMRPLQKRLPPWIALRPLELPGRGRRLGESPRWRLEPLVSVLVKELTRAAARPAVFFGHSMGALLAFEVARKAPPAHLVVSGHRGPQLDRAYLTGHEDDDPTFAAELRRWGGEDAEWLEDDDLRGLFLPVLREDFRALVAYQFHDGPPLSCPITALRGEDDPYLDAAGLEAWAGLTTGRFEQRAVEGGHFYWVRKPGLLLPALEAAAAPLRA